MDVVLRAERVLLGGELRPAAVAVADGLIAAIADVDADYPGATEVVVPHGAVLLPGFVDTHVHVNEPGTDWEGFATATAAAAAGGITTLVDMPLDSDPVTTSVGALEVKKAAAQGNCRINVAYWAGVVPDNIDDLAPLADAGVRGFKCFLADSGNPKFGHLTPAQFRTAMTRVADLDSVMLVHAESHQVIERGPRPSGRGYASFLASRPDAAEEQAVKLVIETAAATGSRAHVVHVSSSYVLPLIADAKRSGVRVTAETCPHYLTFVAETIPDGATEFAACPPIRDAGNRNRLWDALLDGTLDMIVSDHSPCAPELKGDGDFGRAFGGVSSLELGLRAVWTQAATRGIGLAELSLWMSARPATLAGFADRGRIEVGLRADLCVLAPDVDDVVDVDALHHRHPVSPYHGVTLRGSVLQTWVAGERVFARLEAAA
ncbi:MULTISPECIES: allantoinase AllB [unclassified Mycobacterium]|uniref:allantoinase AllB n=1 Tax=unclassified Mycobacterium TaxID=2642494 RepID=UPI0029C93559|nr:MULTISPECIES: allantoinase AllB [unclassified Mycobacterium]